MKNAELSYIESNKKCTKAEKETHTHGYCNANIIMIPSLTKTKLNVPPLHFAYAQDEQRTLPYFVATRQVCQTPPLVPHP